MNKAPHNEEKTNVTVCLHFKTACPVMKLLSVRAPTAPLRLIRNRT